MNVLYTVSQKTTLMLHTIDSTHINRYRLMWVESIVCNISVVFLGHSVYAIMAYLVIIRYRPSYTVAYPRETIPLSFSPLPPVFPYVNSFPSSLFLFLPLPSLPQLWKNHKWYGFRRQSEGIFGVIPGKFSFCLCVYAWSDAFWWRICLICGFAVSTSVNGFFVIAEGEHGS